MRASHLMLVSVIVALTSTVIVADDKFDESKTIHKIELLGGSVTRDDTLPGRPVIGVDFRRSNRFNEKYLHLLKSFTSLTTLNLKDSAITDDGMKKIGELTNLTCLNLWNTQVTDAG